MATLPRGNDRDFRAPTVPRAAKLAPSRRLAAQKMKRTPGAGGRRRPAELTGSTPVQHVKGEGEGWFVSKKRPGFAQPHGEPSQIRLSHRRAGVRRDRREHGGRARTAKRPGRRICWQREPAGMIPEAALMHLLFSLVPLPNWLNIYRGLFLIWAQRAPREPV